MAIVTGLSGNEIFCMDEKGFDAGELVVGNSVNSMSWLRSYGADYGIMAGGEVQAVTQQIQEARIAAFERMEKEAEKHGADGVVGVTSELKHHGNNNTEFVFVGSTVRTKGDLKRRFFSSAGNAQELYCHMDAGYQPLRHVFGNIAYSMGFGGSFSGFLNSLKKGEVTEYSDVFNQTRHTALSRIVSEAKHANADAVVGIRTKLMWWNGTHEMTMTGTAVTNPLLSQNRDVVTSDLTGEELWALTKMGYEPVKLLMSTSVYSTGLKGSIKAWFKSQAQGEIKEFTEMVHEAREIAIGRMSKEADNIGATKVVGVKTHIWDLGSGLVEFMAIGTAVKKNPNVKVQTAQLPAQAILHDKDTWIEHAGLTLERE